MKKSFFACVGSVLLSLLSPAFAADMPLMPLKGPPAPYAVPYYNWTGFYIGINGGYGFGRSDWGAPVSTPNFDVNGAVVGGTLGYNFQTGAIVWGVEGDFDWSNIRGTSHFGACGAPGCQTENNWLGTARLRLGYAFDRWLPFVTGGAAFGDVRAQSVLGKSSSTEFGWTAGAGIEWAFFSNWTAKVEYLYVDLGDGSCRSACSAVSIPVAFQTNLVRAGINYRF
jgi:outer membrane immunogenic protein